MAFELSFYVFSIWFSCVATHQMGRVNFRYFQGFFSTFALMNSVQFFFYPNHSYRNNYNQRVDFFLPLEIISKAQETLEPGTFCSWNSKNLLLDPGRKEWTLKTRGAKSFHYMRSNYGCSIRRRRMKRATTMKMRTNRLNGSIERSANLYQCYYSCCVYVKLFGPVCCHHHVWRRHNSIILLVGFFVFGMWLHAMRCSFLVSFDCTMFGLIFPTFLSVLSPIHSEWFWLAFTSRVLKFKHTIFRNGAESINTFKLVLNADSSDILNLYNDRANKWNRNTAAKHQFQCEITKQWINRNV